MNACVMKFGGTSLQNHQTRQLVYDKIRAKAKKQKVVVVVSAMGRGLDPYATDTLLQLVSPHICEKDKNALVSIGELLSSIVVTSELQELGCNVIRLSFEEAGIIKDNDHISFASYTMKQALQHYDIVVVGGFIVCNANHQYVTLGRGGSDYSAILFAHMLGLDEVEIYTDVDGIYNKDPRIYHDAIKYDEISYDQVLSMNAKVLAKSCVCYAKKHHITIYVTSTMKEHKGSIVHS